MKKYKLHMNILTFCDHIKNPERFKMIQDALPSLKEFKNEDVLITLWDNGSSKEVKNFLKTLDFIDFLYESKENFYDVAPILFLEKMGRNLQTEFVCHMEDDLKVINKNFLNSIFDFFEDHQDVGGMRILKYEYYNQRKYIKGGGAGVDRSNMQTHRNVVSGKPLLWEGPFKYGTHTIFKNNWHWYNFPIITRSSVYSKLIAQTDIEPLQFQEGHMMKKYYKTKLKLGVFDQGIVNHLGSFNPQESMRYFMKVNQQNLKGTQGFGQELPIISYFQSMQEVDNAIQEFKNEQTSVI